MSKKNRDKAASPKKVASPAGLELIAAGLSLAAAAVAKERAKQRGGARP